MDDILKLFRKFNLIGTNGEIGDEDFTIILYPSLQFSLNENEFVSFVKDAEKKMKGSDDGTEKFAGNEIEESDAEDDAGYESDDENEDEIDPFDVEIDSGEEN